MSKEELFTSLIETEFQKRVIAPLMRKMGYKHVRITHGAEEFGKDVVGFVDEPIGNSLVAVVAKAGDISGRTSPAKHIELLDTIERQIKQAFEIPVEDPTRTGLDKKQYVNKVLVWTSGTITGNAEKQIIKQLDNKYRRVEFIDKAKTLDLLEEHYPEFFTIGDEGIATYFEKAKMEHSRLVELHMLGSNNNNHSLARIFVEPTLEQVQPDAKISKQAKYAGISSKKIEYKTLLNDVLNKKSQKYVILGDMGTGKTTLLRRLVIDIVDDNLDQAKKYPLPLLIDFRDLDISETNPIQSSLQSCYDRFSPEHDTRNLESDFSNEHVVAIFDGLDELEEETERLEAISLIRAFSKRFPTISIIMSSRQDSLFQKSTIISGFETYKILPLSISQVTNLVENWFELDNTKGKRLIKLITEPVTLQTIQTTPLTIALIATLYENGINDLPSSLTELFEQYTELALGRWDRGRDITNITLWTIKERVLRQVSWELLNKGKLEIEKDYLNKRVEQYIQDKGLKDESEQFFKELIERSGLFVSLSETTVEFKHRAFRDFFAGVELSEKANAAETMVNKFYEESWATPIFFAVGKKREADDFIKRIIDDVPIIDNKSAYYGWRIGLIGQAAYLASNTTKIEIVKASANALVIAWDVITQEINKKKNGKTELEHKFPHHMFLLFYFTLYCRFALGSPTLGAALKQVALECLDKLPSLEDLDARQKAEIELFSYTIAMASAQAGELDVYVKLVESPLIQNPPLILRALRETETMLEEEYAVECDFDEQRLKDLEKKLKRVVSHNKQLIVDLQSSPPLMLPSKESD